MAKKPPTTPPRDDSAERMMALFGGNKKNYGTHGEPDLDENGVKWKIKRTAESVRGEVTVAVWQAHIDGKKPLGIVPIDETSKCNFGSIDVDDYDADMLEVIKRVEAAKLPLVPCRSKSGGLHLFLFAAEPVDAGLMQTTLRDVAASLGLGNCEIFPKQSRLLSERGEMGSWIIMPYFGGDYGGKLKLQHGLKKTGAEMTITEFIRTAEKARVNPADISLVRVKAPKKERAPFSDGPPCLQHLASQPGGVGQGGQNNTLFHMGVYFKRSHPSDWKTKLEEANQKYMRPVHPSDGVASVIRSLEKQDYEYKCKDVPMCNHCDALLCRTRKHGVGMANAYPVITSLQKLDTEPPVWFASVEGHSITLSTQELQNYVLFHRLCMEYTNKCFTMLRQDVWLSLVAEAMANLESLPAPPEVGAAGIFLEHLETFLTNRQRGQKLDDLLSGRPYENEDERRHYFRLQDLQKYLEREGVRNLTRPQMTARLRAIGGLPRQFNLKNKYSVNAWSVPSDKFHAAPPIDPPESAESEI